MNDREDTERSWQRVLYSGHRGARVTAGVFGTLAVLILVGGAISAVAYAKWLHDNTGLSNGQIGAIVVGIVVGTVISASLWAFLAYVLGLLVDIEINTRESAVGVRGTGRTPPPRVRAPIPR